MKKLATFVFALLLAGSLSFAQATGTGTEKKPETTDTTKKAHKGKKAHKSSKKKKAAETTAAPETKK
jgi:hypothetical protein